MSLTRADTHITSAKTVGIVIALGIQTLLFLAFTLGMQLGKPNESPLPAVHLVPIKPTEPTKKVEPQPVDVKSVIPTEMELAQFTRDVPRFEQAQDKVIPEDKGSQIIEPRTDGEGVDVSPHIGTERAALAVLRRVDPAYPAAAIRAGAQGTVWLSVVVEADGKVTGVSVLQSSGDNTLDQAAMEAVRRWRFTAPATGMAAVKVPITFRLQSVRF